MPTDPATDPTTLAAGTLPHLCGDCGYRLDGLPPAGQCPECGGAYRSDQVVLFGWAGGTMAHAANSRRGRMTAFGFVKALAITGAVILVQPRARGVFFGVWVVVAMLAGWSAYHFRRLRAAGTPPVQLRLGPRGVVQRDGAGPPDSVEPWEGQWRVRLTSPKPASHRLVMERVPTEWLAVPGRAVDFEFDAGPTAVTALRHLVESYVAAAGGTVEVVTGGAAAARRRR